MTLAVKFDHQRIEKQSFSDMELVLRAINQTEGIDKVVISGTNLKSDNFNQIDIPVTIASDVDTFTNLPVLNDSPYRYAVINTENDEIKTLQLNMPKQNCFSDVHIHTPFAYCSNDNLLPEDVIKRAQLFGLKSIGIVEHSGQLYVSNEDYWSGNFIQNPGLINDFKNTKFNRMKKYKEYVNSYKSENVKLGLEVEADCAGKLTLLPEDSNGWDFLLGAVHYIPDRFKDDVESGFMWSSEAVLNNGVDILAHPFRFFIRNELKPPKELYAKLAKLLKKYNTAAEINFHTNSPDLEFFKICIQEGVKIAFGSDSHELYEIAALNKQITFLEKIAINNDFEKILLKF